MRGVCECFCNCLHGRIAMCGVGHETISIYFTEPASVAGHQGPDQRNIGHESVQLWDLPYENLFEV